MSKRIPKVILEDIIECIEKMLNYTAGMNYDDFLADSKTREAVYRNLEVMGEATNRMPEEYILDHPEIEWNKMIATRNVIIHAYDEIDDAVVWNIITTILPGLKVKLEKLG